LYYRLLSSPSLLHQYQHRTSVAQNGPWTAVDLVCDMRYMDEASNRKCRETGLIQGW